MASAVSGYMPVREKLVELQKQLAAKENVIMDGRDIGTCVLPDAPAKIYLTASVEVRAVRRYKELLEKGMEADLKTFTAMGVYGMTALTVIVAQNPLNWDHEMYPIGMDVIEKQIKTIVEASALTP